MSDSTITHPQVPLTPEQQEEVDALKAQAIRLVREMLGLLDRRWEELRLAREETGADEAPAP